MMNGSVTRHYRNGGFFFEDEPLDAVLAHLAPQVKDLVATGYNSITLRLHIDPEHPGGRDLWYGQLDVDAEGPMPKEGA